MSAIKSPIETLRLLRAGTHSLMAQATGDQLTRLDIDHMTSSIDHLLACAHALEKLLPSSTEGVKAYFAGRQLIDFREALADFPAGESIAP